jgi:hypothetical protein
MNHKKADIFLTDNEKLASKIVKFLMTAPTIWHHLFWKITGRIKKERPKYYHGGIVLNENKIIEQQGKVEINDLQKIYKKKYIIYQNNKLTDKDRMYICSRAMKDLGEGYGIAECFGKLIGWLTGIKWFAKWFDMKDRAICIVRVAEWYEGIDNFGVNNPNYITTKQIERYCEYNPDWICIYKQEE